MHIGHFARYAFGIKKGVFTLQILYSLSDALFSNLIRESRAVDYAK